MTQKFDPIQEAVKKSAYTYARMDMVRFLKKVGGGRSKVLTPLMEERIRSTVDVVFPIIWEAATNHARRTEEMAE